MATTRKAAPYGGAPLAVVAFLPPSTTAAGMVEREGHAMALT